jgi:tetratricopeptide (TPR) repeat protein
MLTNLGNVFDTVGRFVEANECWSKALTLSPDFGMSIGNRGIGLVTYAKHLYDRGQAGILLKEAYRLLSDALLHDLDKGTEEIFRQYLKSIKMTVTHDCTDSHLLTSPCSLGDTAPEQAYRAWCLDNRLFLNPLNDLGSYCAAAHDCLTCPPITTKLSDGAFYQYPGFFNQMVQEYVSARFLSYDGSRAEDVHFSDRGVKLIDTLDYPAHCLNVEKQKLAFRAAYSILDKVAYFLNSYMALSIPERRVSFNTLWFRDTDRQKGLRPEFQGRSNLPMRGLFWLSKDLHDHNVEYKESIEPEAQAIAEIRNHAEHKCLRVHDDIWSPAAMPTELLNRAFSNQLEYPIRRSEFAAKVLRMLQMTRSALIYLSLAVHEEERGRVLQRDPNVPIGKLPTGKIDDEWKR